MSISRWLKAQKQDGNGLFATLEELIEMRRYSPYVQNFRQKKSFSSQAGDIRSAFKGRGMEFEEIRSYNFGDDVRDIDWRVTARKENPFTKVYAEERDHEIYVWVDLSAQMLFGSKKELKSVSAAKIASLLGWIALENKDKFGCVIFDGAESQIFKAQNNRAQLMAILKNLANSGKYVLQKSIQSELGLTKSLKLLEQNVKNKATVFMLSDFTFLGDNELKHLAALSKKSSLYLVNIFDVLEENPPKSGEYFVEYGGKRLIFDSSSKIYKHDYFAYFASKRAELKSFCRKFGCKLVEFRTDKDIRKNLKFI